MIHRMYSSFRGWCLVPMDKLFAYINEMLNKNRAITTVRETLSSY